MCGRQEIPREIQSDLLVSVCVCVCAVSLLRVRENKREREGVCWSGRERERCVRGGGEEIQTQGWVHCVEDTHGGAAREW